jgi:sirohydrochlorin ferrochelatase
MKAILLIDHGSRRSEANNMLACMANLVQQLVGDEVIVEYAHMELADPDIAAGFAGCVRRGATEVIAFPYMLSPGRHSTADIPRLVAEAATASPGIPFRVTRAFGMHEKLAEVILDRAGVTASADGTVGARCVRPAGAPECFCGNACPALGADEPVAAADL